MSEKKLNNIGMNLFIMTAASIQNNATSLIEQIQEYEFLFCTMDELKQLDEIEKKFHALVQQITHRK